MHLQLTRPDHAAVAPCQAHRLATGLVDQTHDVLLHLTCQHPLHHFHGFSVGHPHSLYEFTFFAQALQRVFDLWTPAMHHHRVHAHKFEQHHILGKAGLQLRIGHGVATVFDNQGFAMELADIGQGAGEYFSFVAVGGGGKVLARHGSC